jgi:hypothetical protein
MQAQPLRNRTYFFVCKPDDSAIGHVFLGGDFVVANRTWRVSNASILRQELGKFLRETGNWSVLGIDASVQMGSVFDLRLVNPDTRQCFWRVFAIGTADYAIRPSNPALIIGGPYIRLSTDDPRLSDPDLQYIPGGDGETFNPPRRYQLLELDQSWIVAERFEIEPLPQTTVG